MAGKVQLNPRRPERGGVYSTGLYLTQLIDSLSINVLPIMRPSTAQFGSQ